MQIETRVKGNLTVTEDQKVTVPKGLFGFEDYTEYALIESKYEPFMWLQSLQEKNLAFLVVDPFMINSEYEADIDDKELMTVGISDPADVMVMAIVTVPSDGGPATANFQGPLIFNRKTRVCMQAVLNDPRWSTKENIIEALKKKEVN